MSFGPGILCLDKSYCIYVSVTALKLKDLGSEGVQAPPFLMNASTHILNVLHLHWLD
uniref:Uncharacterized protein n=1 Tax=Kalanchoe fedtschenkoi TaxID=63787 RepID=A0A7N0VA98_KALFE